METKDEKQDDLMGGIPLKDAEEAGLVDHGLEKEVEEDRDGSS